MSNMENRFHKDIEIERLWIATEQGGYVFFALLFISLLLIFGLWDMASHRLLLIWFAMLTTLNFIRWMVLRYFYQHKTVLIANIRQVKRFLIVSAGGVGLCWGLAAIWFIQPSQPGNVIILAITLNIEVIGAILTWFCYLPAAVAILVPITLPLVYFLFKEGSNAYIATAMILSLLTLLAIKSSLNIAKMLNHALTLNFENAALRKESEEKSVLLETALENMSQGICMSDQDDKLRMWNQQFTNLLGKAGRFVKIDANLSALLKIAGLPIIMNAEGRAEYHMNTGQVYEIREVPLIQGGRVLTYTDITESIQRERELEKANAAKTLFLAVHSHDLLQPIHALRLFFARLSDQVFSPETAMVIGQIEYSIATINSMLNALVEIAKLDAKVDKPRLKTIRLGHLLERLGTEFRPIALESHNELHIRPTLAIVDTDPDKLERMLRNLISNALRYTVNGRILVAARRRGQHVEIQVRDNGPGIPKDKLEEIFVEFYQLNRHYRRQGLGLGLAIVKSLSQLLGYKIKVASRLGQGSCFSITLPLADDNADSVPTMVYEPSYGSSNILAGCLALVLDDDLTVLEAMQGLLLRWECQVITAASPTEAEEKLANITHRPDLLIIDYGLPGNVSGIEVARQLQSRLDDTLKVLIITGDTNPERIQEASTYGYPLLHKPVQPAKLRSLMQYLLTKSGKSIRK